MQVLSLVSASTVRIFSPAMFSLVFASFAMESYAATPTVQKRGWFAGVPIMMEVELPAAAGGKAPNAPSAAHPDAIVYLTAPTRSAASASPEMKVPTPQGARVLPAHDDVVTVLTGKQRADAIGYFVVRGPRSDDSNTRWQSDPTDSIPGGPLVREIFVGTDWVKLTSHAVIEYGVAMGWLALEYFDYGGLVTTRFIDVKARLDVEIDVQPPVALPSATQGSTP